MTTFGAVSDAKDGTTTTLTEWVFLESVNAYDIIIYDIAATLTEEILYSFVNLGKCNGHFIMNSAIMITIFTLYLYKILGTF